MDDKHSDSFSKPDYTAWENCIRDVREMPPSRFYFTVTQLILGGITLAALKWDYWWLALILSIVISVFGFWAHRSHTEGDNHARTEEPEAESSDQRRG
jgi:hypothetical protein